jgi:hypothetical protein
MPISSRLSPTVCGGIGAIVPLLGTAGTAAGMAAGAGDVKAGAFHGAGILGSTVAGRIRTLHTTTSADSIRGVMQRALQRVREVDMV